jgi:hypothetical protein
MRKDIRLMLESQAEIERMAKLGIDESIGKTLLQKAFGHLGSAKDCLSPDLASSSHRQIVDYVRSISAETKQRDGLLSEYSNVFPDIQRSLVAKSISSFLDESYRRPEFKEVAFLASQAIEQKSMAAAVFSSNAGSASLQAAMAAMKNPWLDLEREIQSAAAFSDIHAIGLLVHSPAAFSEEVAILLRSDLGDWRDVRSADIEPTVDSIDSSSFYRLRGFNSALTHFPIHAFDESLQISGLRRPGAETPAIGESDEAKRRHSANCWLYDFETEFRLFLSLIMTRVHGEKWMESCLPKGMLVRFGTGRHRDSERSDAEGELIDQTLTSDYLKIISHEDNWATVFEPIFGQLADVQESLRRIVYVRNRVSHHRPLTQEDELTLAAEITRITNTIRRADTKATSID